MGNAQSQQKKSADMYFNEELINSIDLLASKLIFEQSFQNLKKLDDPRYCNEVSILTQQLLKKKLDPININIVSTRIKYGTQDLYVIDELGTTYSITQNGPISKNEYLDNIPIAIPIETNINNKNEQNK